MPKCKLFKNIPLHVQELNCERNIYELEDHVGEYTLSSDWPPKHGPTTRIFPTSFYSCLLKSA
jgi:hypothetical protein